MSDLTSMVFALVFGITFFLAVIYGLFGLYISRKYFSKSCLKLYEEQIAGYGFSLNDTIEQSASKVKKVIKYMPIKTEATIDSSDSRIIVVNKSLDAPKRNFAAAHELGHSLRGYTDAVARNKRSLFSKLSSEEQICDYYAAAILLPLNDMRKWLDNIDFFQKSEENKADCISELARRKSISEDVVYRRIAEISLLDI